MEFLPFPLVVTLETFFLRELCSMNASYHQETNDSQGRALEKHMSQETELETQGNPSDVVVLDVAMLANQYEQSSRTETYVV